MFLCDFFYKCYRRLPAPTDNGRDGVHQGREGDGVKGHPIAPLSSPNLCNGIPV